MSFDEKVTSIILAGGQGSRLHPLTRYRSKPAVPIGGKFRLIDIPISNCLHADIRNIWIVTQFASESIHRHIFSTYRMDPFDKGYISILAAAQTAEHKGWYQGTADAVRQNLRFFESAYNNIMILSGDHLYRMDYKKFLEFHQENDADISISVIPMPEDRVPELGILKIDKDNRIVDFVEKPTDENVIKDFTIPASVKKLLKENLGVTTDKTHFASMGIYLFKKKVLFDLLNNCDHDDFGKQIIPR
ncbi:MAG: NTP transferase domain-containing protein, partial [Calditrichia bacterium]|nr:NTP transferase domain-containing protein [Calditrichia bacterium]